MKPICFCYFSCVYNMRFLYLHIWFLHSVSRIVSSFFFFFSFSILFFLFLIFKTDFLNWLIYSFSLSRSLSHTLIIARLHRSTYYQIIGFPNCTLSRSRSLQKKGTNWRKSRPNCIIFSFIYYGWNFVSHIHYFSLFPLFPHRRPMGLTAILAR